MEEYQYCHSISFLCYLLTFNITTASRYIFLAQREAHAIFIGVALVIKKNNGRCQRNIFRWIAFDLPLLIFFFPCYIKYFNERKLILKQIVAQAVD